MKRYYRRLLAAYAVAMTLLAAWLGCRAYVYFRFLGGRSTDFLTGHAQAVSMGGGPTLLTASVDRSAMLFGSLEPANLAAAVFVIFLAFLALGPKMRTPPTGHPPED